VIVTVAMLLTLPSESISRYRKVSVPLKPAAGVYWSRFLSPDGA
jgi:hypothetical protein